MPGSIVLGANGQDGSYLCEVLQASDQRVVGVGQQANFAGSPAIGDFEYHQLDLRDLDALRSLLFLEQPDHIYHVAAVHGEAGFRYEELVADVFAVSVLSLHVCLEYLRKLPEGRLFYASSSKVFGAEPLGNISEKSEKSAHCIYSTAKIAAGNLIDCYRRDHAVQAIVAFMFNHESPRRKPGYFVPKIARALRNALAGDGEAVDVNTLNFFADWGSAREYMEMSVKAMQLELSGDYAFASGKTLWAAAAVEDLFGSHGLDFRQWINAPIVEVAPANPSFVVDAEKIQLALDFAPRLGFSQLVEEIADATASQRGRAGD